MTSILDKIGTVSENPPPFKACLFGPPGSGKTVLAAGAPKPLIMDVEQGTRSLLNHSWTRDTPKVPITSHQDVIDIIWEAREGNLDQFETLILDTGTELQARALSERLVIRHQKDPSKYDPYTPQMLDYKENSEKMRRLVVALFDLPQNVIILAHSDDIKDDSDGKIYTRPAFTPKLARTVRGLMHVTGFVTATISEKGEFQQKLQVHPTDRIEAKCRIGGLPIVIENPTMEMLLKANVENPPEPINPEILAEGDDDEGEI